ncbi:MAG: hypothetical protein K1X88_18240 [Nannocystaceae bacterium]|nr:hypothetical protein [Nannocystaceae bacterium]
MRLAVLSGLFVATIACAPRDATPSPSPTPASETPAKAAAPARAQPSGPARAGESRVLTGTLRYTEIPAGVQSVAAFRSEDLTLVGEAGETWNLAGSSTVPESQLVALAGKRIEVTATYVAPAAPPADVAAPMDGSAPMQYPARWDVTAVRELGP